MKINVRIERLVIEGLSVTAAQGGLLASAFKVELSRLLIADGSPGKLSSTGAVSYVRGNPLLLVGGANNDQTQLGRAIAKSVSSAIGHSKQRGSILSNGNN